MDRVASPASALNWHICANGRQHAQLDAYVNVVHLLTLDEPHREIRIVVNGVVEIEDSAGVVLPDEGSLSPVAGEHCRLAVGRDYMDACPVRGVRRGGEAEEMHVAVSVASAAQQ